MSTRTKALMAFVALFAAAFAYACTLTDITGVEVGQLTIQPPSATILEGATVQLSVQAQDQLGGSTPSWGGGLVHRGSQQALNK